MLGLSLKHIAFTQPVTTNVAAPNSVASKIVQGAKKQLVNPARWTSEYYPIPYPNGDLPPEKGACSDVIVRALRHASYDLQKLIYEDAAKVRYPHIQKRDRNIDHRRVRNQVVYFRRFGKSFPVDAKKPHASKWLPGDFIVWKLPNNLDHIGIISDKRLANGNYLVIHNLGMVAEEDVVGSWRLTGHYRFPLPRAPRTNR